MKRVVFVATLCVVVAVPLMADMVENGSFEDGSDIPPSGYLGLAPGSTDIAGWTVIGSGVRVVDYIGDYWQASDGARSVDLDGYESGNGGVEQAITTTAGNNYLVTFDMAGNPGGDPTTKTMDVTVLPYIALPADLTFTATLWTDSFTFDTTGHSTTSMGWTEEQFEFNAISDITTLRFMSTTSGDGYGPVFDNVRVLDISVVPVPAAALLGMLGLSVAGVKLRRLV